MKICLKVIVWAFLLSCVASKAHAALGLAREAYGVWDRGGWHLVSDYPYTLGQAYAELWSNIEPSRTNFNWTALDQLLQFADDQNQKFNVQILPIGGAAGSTVPLWMSNNVPLFTESPNVGGYTYGLYTNSNYKIYFQEMVEGLARHLRTEVNPTLRARIAFVRCDTGCTGDEAPYENPQYISAQYQISNTDWRDFREWAFEVYRHAFQDGTNGPVIPLLFQDIEQTGFPHEWNWVTNHVLGGFGGKLGGPVRGHNWSGSGSISDSYRPYAVGGSLKIFSRNEMDQSWQDNPMFQSNLVLNMYWCAVEQLHAGMSVWDVSSSCLENASASNFVSSLLFFNKWTAHLDPPTAGGGFCILRDGLDASDTGRFPAAIYGSPANQGNTNRYAAICATNAMNGARMDDLYAATRGALYQRNNQQWFNDSAWDDIPGNYERFITQLEPTNSPGVWRIYGATNGTLTRTSHPFDRFARRFDHANGKDAMYFDINDSLLTSPGQRVELTVIYRDKGTGQFALLFDALTNSQKTAFTVTKGNTLTWKTNTVVVTDWAFANRGPKGADLVLTNLGADDTIFHSIELVKLADVNVGTVGKGTVSGRTDFTVYSPIMTNNVMERQRIGLTATPAVGWRFIGWTGDTNDLSGGDVGGTNTRPFLFPRNGCQLTANFQFITGAGGSTTSADDFTSGTLTNGTGWSGGWTTSGTVVPGAFVELNGTTGNAQITRTLAVAVTNATLSFDWDLDRIGSGEYGAVSVFNGVWQQVWQQTDPGLDANNAGDANLVTTTTNLSALGSVSQIRFTLNASGSNNRFYIDNVRVTGTPAVTATNTQPLFTSDPILKTPATNGAAYAGTLTNNASDPGGNPLIFSKVSGPAWLSVSNNGVLYGTPLSTDVGLNSWLVRITNSVGGSDDAILLINVVAVPAPVGVPATIAVADSTGGSAANSSLTIAQTLTVNSGNVLVANLSYRGTNNNYPISQATLAWVTGGGTVTQTMTRAVEAGNTAAKAYGSSVYYLWNPNTGSGTISGSLPSTNQLVHIISAFTLTGVDTNASPIIVSNIDDTTGNSSINSSIANVPAGGFASLCAASAGTANGTGFTNSPAGGTVTNWFQNNYSGGYWDQGYISSLGGGNTTFSCAFVGGGRMHIVAAVFTPGTAKASATVNLSTLSQTYDGTAKCACATTTPTNLTVNLTYNGSANCPTNAGSYTVVGTISDANYQGSATNMLNVGKASATVNLSSLSQTYTGTAKCVNATTTPTNLQVNLTYNGSANCPTNAGSYTVVGTISDVNYQGSATNTLVIQLQPPLLSAAITNSHQLWLQFTGGANGNYILQSASNLIAPINWQPVLTNPADANGVWQFTDTNLNSGIKFYRVLSQ